MVRHTIFAVDLIVSVVSLLLHLQDAQRQQQQQGQHQQPALQEVAKFERDMATGIAISKSGHIFVHAGKVNHTALEEDAIVRFTPAKQMDTGFSGQAQSAWR